MKYVNFETAQLLRERGFDEKCFFCYENDWGNKTCKLVTKVSYCNSTSTEDGLRNSALKEYGGAHWEYISAPTFSEVLDWLRDTHKLHIYAFYTNSDDVNKWCYEVEKITDDWTYSKHYGRNYDECIEEAIIYTLINFVNGKSQKPLNDIIEISPYILEKNGFTKEHDVLLNKEFFMSKDCRVSITLSDDKMSPKIWSCHVDDIDMNTIGRIYISYISELKSFLKLCGYDETFFN